MSDKYGCHNRPRPTAMTYIIGQEGWAYEVPHDPPQGTRVPVLMPVRFNNSTECRYDKSDVDSRCKGCNHAIGAEPEGFKLISRTVEEALSTDGNCIWCNDPFNAPELYIYEVSVFNNKTQFHHWHPECHNEAIRTKAFQFTPRINPRPPKE